MRWRWSKKNISCQMESRAFEPTKRENSWVKVGLPSATSFWMRRRSTSMLASWFRKQVWLRVVPSKSWCLKLRFTGVWSITTCASSNTFSKTSITFTSCSRCARINQWTISSNEGSGFTSSRYNATQCRWLALCSIYTPTGLFTGIWNSAIFFWTTRWRLRSGTLAWPLN